MIQFVSQKKLMAGIPYRTLFGTKKNKVTHVACHTGQIRTGGAFVCIAGTHMDGHRYAVEAILQGAGLIVVERMTALLQEFLNSGNCPAHTVVLQVSDTRRAFGIMCQNYFGRPDSALQLVGITGTKGKTTTSFMLRAMLEQKYRTGLIGTNGAWIEGEHIPLDHTTPSAYELYELLYRMQKRGITHVVMEVSSQGLKQHRIGALRFAAAAYTNLSCDHINATEHEDMQEYAYWKRTLAQKSCSYLVNREDPNSAESGSNHPNLHSFSVKNCDIDGKIWVEWEEIEKDTRFGAWMKIKQGKDNGRRKTEKYYIPCAFGFNRENAMTAMGLYYMLEGQLDTVKALSALNVPGRMQAVYVSEDMKIMIDYAHNESSLERVLKALREFHPKRLVCLFGCGGERAKDRRYRMGAVSAKWADLTIVTQDNSRGEPLENILQDIITGIRQENGRYVVIPDRREAIHYAIKSHKPGDYILLAGKGHEDYIITGENKEHFSEADIVREAVISDEAVISEP